MRYIKIQRRLSNRNSIAEGCIIKYRIKEGVTVGETLGIPSTKSLKMQDTERTYMQEGEQLLREESQLKGPTQDFCVSLSRIR